MRRYPNGTRPWGRPFAAFAAMCRVIRIEVLALSYAESTPSSSSVRRSRGLCRSYNRRCDVTCSSTLLSRSKFRNVAHSACSREPREDSHSCRTSPDLITPDRKSLISLPKSSRVLRAYRLAEPVSL